MAICSVGDICYFGSLFLCKIDDNFAYDSFTVQILLFVYFRSTLNQNSVPSSIEINKIIHPPSEVTLRCYRQIGYCKQYPRRHLWKSSLKQGKHRPGYNYEQLMADPKFSKGGNNVSVPLSLIANAHKELYIRVLYGKK